MIERIEYSIKVKDDVLKRLSSRTEEFYQQFSRPVEFNRKVFGEPLSPIQSVRRILEEVQRNGLQAVRKYSKIFDGVDPEPITVEKSQWKAAVDRLDKDVVKSLEKSVINVTEYQKRLLPENISMSKTGNAMCGARYQPLQRVGIYIPGGTAPLCSSVVMNALPAVVAGVPEVVVFTPPQKDGSVDDGILAACQLVGVNAVYRVGGVPAIGMMAYGVEGFSKVFKIAGPGNSYVTLAKKEVYGHVDIDLFAGPSEILIIADESSQPSFLAADMLAQAEHDKVASSILISTSNEILDAVEVELQKQLAVLPRKEIAEVSIKEHALLIKVASIEEAIQLSNLVAPEHLELAVNQPDKFIEQIYHAGAIFMGHYTPEAAGDYLSGPSHTLPTSGTGKFYSGVSSTTFVRRTSLIHYEKDDFFKDAEAISQIAKLEQLDGHARSALIRKERL